MAGIADDRFLQVEQVVAVAVGPGLEKGDIVNIMAAIAPNIRSVDVIGRIVFGMGRMAFEGTFALAEFAGFVFKAHVMAMAFDAAGSAATASAVHKAIGMGMAGSAVLAGIMCMITG